MCTAECMCVTHRDEYWVYALRDKPREVVNCCSGEFSRPRASLSLSVCECTFGVLLYMLWWKVFLTMFIIT